MHDSEKKNDNIAVVVLLLLKIQLNRTPIIMTTHLIKITSSAVPTTRVEIVKNCGSNGNGYATTNGRRTDAANCDNNETPNSALLHSHTHSQSFSTSSPPSSSSSPPNENQSSADKSPPSDQGFNRYTRRNSVSLPAGLDAIMSEPPEYEPQVR